MFTRMRAHVRQQFVGYLALFIALGGTAAGAGYVVTRNAQVARNTIAGSAAPKGRHSNIILIDDNVGVVQPYLPGTRGVDSPTLVLHRRWQDLGLFPMFEAIYCSLWEKSKPL